MTAYGNLGCSVTGQARPIPGQHITCDGPLERRARGCGWTTGLRLGDELTVDGGQVSPPERQPGTQFIGDLETNARPARQALPVLALAQPPPHCPLGYPQSLGRQVDVLRAQQTLSLQIQQASRRSSARGVRGSISHRALLSWPTRQPSKPSKTVLVADPTDNEVGDLLTRKRDLTDN